MQQKVRRPAGNTTVVSYLNVHPYFWFKSYIATYNAKSIRSVELSDSEKFTITIVETVTIMNNNMIDYINS